MLGVSTGSYGIAGFDGGCCCPKETALFQPADLQSHAPALARSKVQPAHLLSEADSWRVAPDPSQERLYSDQLSPKSTSLVSLSQGLAGSRRTLDCAHLGSLLLSCATRCCDRGQGAWSVKVLACLPSPEQEALEVMSLEKNRGRVLIPPCPSPCSRPALSSRAACSALRRSAPPTQSSHSRSSAPSILILQKRSVVHCR